MKTTDIYRPQKNKGKLEQQMINEFYPLLFSIYKSRLITNGLNLDSISAIYRNTRSQKYNILFLRIYLKDNIYYTQGTCIRSGKCAKCQIFGTFATPNTKNPLYQMFQML